MTHNIAGNTKNINRRNFVKIAGLFSLFSSLFMGLFKKEEDKEAKTDNTPYGLSPIRAIYDVQQDKRKSLDWILDNYHNCGCSDFDTPFKIEFVNDDSPKEQLEQDTINCWNISKEDMFETYIPNKVREVDENYKTVYPLVSRIVLEGQVDEGLIVGKKYFVCTNDGGKHLWGNHKYEPGWNTWIASYTRPINIVGELINYTRLEKETVIYLKLEHRETENVTR